MGFEIFGVGVPEMVLILVVALIFLGPERLPDAARAIGGWVREIRGLSNEAMGIWRETLQVGDELRQTVQPANLLAPPPTPRSAVERAADPAPTALPLIVPYTAPETTDTNGAELAVLDYPAPFAAPATSPPALLDYPAPFENEE